jgi:transcriptional regulator with XRE-family HTH domain
MDNNSGMKPVAARLAENVRALRKERGFDLADVAEKMAQFGRPLSLNGVSKIERGKRGVDVDELVALALALGVTPNRLLLTPDAGEQPVTLAPDLAVSERAAWQWATGEVPLQVWPPDRRLNSDDDRFEVENRPHVEHGDWTITEVLEHREVLEPIAVAAQAAVKAGVPPITVQNYLLLSQGMWRLTELMGGTPQLTKIDWREGRDDGDR